MTATKHRGRRIPIPREIMAEFRRLADDNKKALADYLRGYRRAFRQRLALGETASEIHESVKKRLREK